MEKRISRRTAIRGAALGAGALVTSPLLPPVLSAPNTDPLVAGVLESVQSERLATIRTSEGPIQVALAEDCTIWRDREASLADFRPNDEIVATGHWQDSDFSASVFMSMLRLLDGRVRARRGNVLELDTGAVLITEETSPEDRKDKAIREIRRGDWIQARGRYDAPSQQLVAIAISALDSQ